jgi:hypothetical protein
MLYIYISIFIIIYKNLELKRLLARTEGVHEERGRFKKRTHNYT